MNIIEKITEKYSLLRDSYNTELQFWLQYLRKQAKEPFREHEWWKEYVEGSETIDDVPIETKYSILVDVIVDLFDDIEKNSNDLRSIFDVIESSLQGASAEELDEIEVLFLEGVENSLSSNQRAYALFYQLLGPKSLLLYECNKDFWKQLANKGGNCSIASAVREEVLMGSFSGRSKHVKKGEQGVRDLQRWLDCNEAACPGDRAAAENVLLDLLQSLGKS